MPPTSSYFSGRVHSVSFADESKAFYILKIVLDSESVSNGPFESSNIITARGEVPGVKIDNGVWFGFEGTWDEHPKYGRQIKITRAPVLKNGWDEDTCEKILVAQGIGSTVAAKIRAQFPGDLVSVLADPVCLQTVPGITLFVAEHIAHKWKTARSQFLTLDFLGDLGLPQGKIRHVWSTFGDRATEVLSVDPWSLLEIDGITFAECDIVARRLSLDCSSSNPNRIRGAIVAAAKTSKGLGHLYLSSGELLGAVRPLDPLMTDRDIATGIRSLVEEKKIVVDRSQSGLTAIYDPWSYRVESESARILAERARTAAIPPDRSARYVKAILGEDSPGVSLREAGSTYLSRVGSNLGIALSPMQTEAVLNALTESVSIITGLPGSGKTTSLRMALNLLHEAGVQPLVVAPTGIAAKRLTSVTGVEASTIHRAFGAQGVSDAGRGASYVGVVGGRESTKSSDGSREEWGFGPENPHPAEVLVIDESSMVDQALLFRALSCTRADARLVFVGDAAQLPSVGAGNVLRDLISSGRFPTVSLTEIFRQADTSPIVTAAHDIFRGRIPEAPMMSDFSLIPLAKEEDVLQTILTLSEKLYRDRKNFQVLSPRHAGTLGVTNLNARLRAILNPAQQGRREVSVGGEALREEDRVIVCKNDYQLKVFNGDVAKVNYIDKNAKVIEIKIHGPPVSLVPIPLSSAPSLLRLAYAVTVHRCVHPDTLVETPEGLLPIRSISSRGEIGTPSGPRPYEDFVSNPELPALRLVTKDGYELTVTPDHGIDVWDGGSYVRREAREIRPGSVVRMSMGVKCDAVAPATLPAPDFAKKEDVYRVPSVMTGDLAELFGLMTEGAQVFPEGFSLGGRTWDVTRRFAYIVRELFGYPATPKGGPNLYTVTVLSRGLSRWVSSVGIGAPNPISVPESVLRSPEKYHRRFLRGLMDTSEIKADTGRSGRQISRIQWGSMSHGTVRTVAVMLLRAGIPSSSLRCRDGSTCILISGSDAARFGREIGFLSKYKQDRTALPGCGSRDWVPLSDAEARGFQFSYRGRVSSHSCVNVIQNGRISRDLLSRCEGYPETEISRLLNERARDHHTVIASVEETESETMCVNVPDGHRFIQNGWVGWNCQGLEYDVVVMPLVESFAHQLQRNLFYTAITRARKKVILVGSHRAMVRAVNNNREDSRNTLFASRLKAALSESSSGVIEVSMEGT